MQEGTTHSKKCPLQLILFMKASYCLPQEAWDITLCVWNPHKELQILYKS